MEGETTSPYNPDFHPVVINVEPSRRKGSPPPYAGSGEPSRGAYPGPSAQYQPQTSPRYPEQFNHQVPYPNGSYPPPPPITAVGPYSPSGQYLDQQMQYAMQHHPGLYGGIRPVAYAQPAQPGYGPNQMMPGAIFVTSPQRGQQQSTVIVNGATHLGPCPRCQNGFVVEEYSTFGIILAIFCFPMGLICCMLMKIRRCGRCGTLL